MAQSSVPFSFLLALHLLEDVTWEEVMLYAVAQWLSGLTLLH